MIPVRFGTSIYMRRSDSSIAGARMTNSQTTVSGAKSQNAPVCLHTGIGTTVLTMMHTVPVVQCHVMADTCFAPRNRWLGKCNILLQKKELPRNKSLKSSFQAPGVIFP